MKSKYFILSLMLGATICSCDDLLEPAIENTMDITAMYKNPSMAQGFLGNAYMVIPSPTSPETDLATDDAVTNESGNQFSKMALGGWTSQNNPVSRWNTCYHAIQYINLVLEHADNVQWAGTEPLRTMYNDHFKGDALGLRAMFHFYLLQVHAGEVNGQLLGVPYHVTSEDASSDFNQPRLTFAETITMILADIDAALELLPFEFVDVTKQQDVPAKYAGATYGEYTRAFGSHHAGKVDGKLLKAVRAQVLLFAASPAFASAGVASYDQAAKAMAEIIEATVGGISGLASNGHTWFKNFDEINALAINSNPAEILWRRGTEENATLDQDNFPPSIFGNGRVNPTQNLVDAFYMANGYPISDPASGYNPQKPYENRDPRFYDAIVYNGSTQGPESTVINTTASNNENSDGLNKEGGKSTRTGYYLRKLTNPSVNCDPSATGKAKRYTPRIRFTELFLGYAEAANEAYGPTSNGGNSFSAYDVVKAIRKRALGLESDPYLESIKDNKDKMRELIRNERRLEFCFENMRFWDLRRWKVGMDKLTEPAKGMKITDNNGTLKYEVITVEERNFSDYQYFGPIPYNEVQKFDALEQNTGW